MHVALGLPQEFDEEILASPFNRKVSLIPTSDKRFEGLLGKADHGGAMLGIRRHRHSDLHSAI
jgi:hypothetical protein